MTIHSVKREKWHATLAPLICPEHGLAGEAQVMRSRRENSPRKSPARARIVIVPDVFACKDTHTTTSLWAVRVLICE